MLKKATSLRQQQQQIQEKIQEKQNTFISSLKEAKVLKCIFTDSTKQELRTFFTQRLILQNQKQRMMVHF